jgi:glycosyltransferase involved in cell wall biosynthesis
MNRKPRLLFAINQAAFFVSHFLHLAKGAQAAGYEVMVAAPPGPGEETIKAAGLTMHPLHLNRKSTAILQELKTFMSVLRVYRAVRPDLVHQFSIKPVLYGGFAARLTRIPAVVSTITGLGFVFIAAGWKARLRRVAVTWAYRTALRLKNFRVIFENSDDRQLFFDNGLLQPDHAVLIRGAGVDTEAFPYTPESLTDSPQVVLAARMLWDKGVGEFVQAAALLRNAGVNARFVLVGDADPGNPKSISVQQLRQWQREGAVEWWGERRDIAAIFAAANIVCLPSYREGLPKVLLEAASCGRAIVTTDVSGCREVVRHGDNGLLIPARETGPLAETLARLIADPALRQKMGLAARARAMAEFSATDVLRQTLAVYREVLK